MTSNRMYDLFVDDANTTVNPELVRLARQDSQSARRLAPAPGRGGQRPRRVSAPQPGRGHRTARQRGPAARITFIFSRAGCDAAVQQCVHAGMRLLGPDESPRVRSYVEARCADIPDEDLGVLGYHGWLDALERGVAAHHAGLLPTFKEVVEELFVQGLVKAVFATETLALGINMPARSVVLEQLVKWNGEAHADVTPGEYTQLTGRAGRRGIDVEGHAVVVWHPGIDPSGLAGLASTRTYPLRSSFRPSYNMAVNLVGQFGRDRARELLESSFAQFQADRAVVGLARQVRRNEEGLEGYPEAMTCHLGDFEEYAGCAARISDREADHLAAAARRTAGRQRHRRWRSCDPATSSGCPAAAGPDSPSCSTPARTAAWTALGPPCSPPSGRCAGSRWSTSRPGRVAAPAADPEDLQRTQPGPTTRPRVDAAQRPRRGQPAARRRARSRPPTTPSCSTCAPG